LHARVYRATGGRGVGRWFSMPVLVLETVGRRSGKPRRTPLIYIERGDELVVIAANGGSDRMPAWWLNLRAAGEGVVTLHGESRRVVPRVVEAEPERSELWSAFARVYPALDEYTTFTDRALPVVVLSR
jgi:deazaflavin-dependent oxidoreductase (nitroreductase family)